ncbi:hypothetical protein [Pararcticibacter amylolyticus]|nr:hypothetical protein [Pararcticibacter amylolyticus]
MKKQLLIFAMAVATIFSACKKNDKNELITPEEEETTSPGTSGVKLLTAVSSGNGERWEFKYDSKNRLSELLHPLASDGKERKEVYSYDEEGKLTGMDMYFAGAVSQKSVYTYSANTITLVLSYPGSTQSSSTEVYTTNSKGQIVSAVAHGANMTYTYNENGSLKSEFRQIDGHPDFDLMTEFTYDNKKGSMINCTTPEWLFYYTHSVIFGKINNMLTLGPDFKFQYEYSEDGFPVKSTFTQTYGSNSMQTVYSYEYSTDKK